MSIAEAPVTERDSATEQPKRVAVVTGAAAGIGFSIAERLAR